MGRVMFSTLFLIQSQMKHQNSPSHFSKFSSINKLMQPPNIDVILGIKDNEEHVPCLTA